MTTDDQAAEAVLLRRESSALWEQLMANMARLRELGVEAWISVEKERECPLCGKKR